MVQQQAAEQLFAGESEMAGLMRSFDWSQTSLGSVEHWSQSLKTAVRIMLTSRQPMFVWWGDDLINLYNDAYKAIVGGKHPEALGQPASIIWQEIWDQIAPRVESAILKNEGTYDEALLLIMERNGYPEETYYTFSYSPIPDDQGDAGGIICANTDDTQRIIGERQLALLRDLAAKTVDARTFDDACMLSVRCLETNPYDLPFAMIYLIDPEQQHAFLAGTAGIDRHHTAVPETVDLAIDTAWALATVMQTHQPCLVADLADSFDPLPLGAWQQSPQQAVAVPIAPSGQTGKAGILVVGLNPFRLFDESYQSFINLIAAQISASIANAQAYEEERKRAEALAELDRAKTIFFSNVSHEFRTPLTLMLSPLEEFAQTLDRRLQPDERQQLAMVQRNGLRLQKLVNTLLDFSRIEAGRVQASYEPTDLATYTTELTSLFRSLIEQAEMTLVIDCPPLAEWVYVDRDMWEKIVLNLLSNAFKFTFAGKITVRLQPVGNAVELSVSDTGVGIPEAELPRLFERFHRVSETRSRTYEGSGIGLALVQELVKLHGGTIRVTSQLEHGTTFTIALPFGSAHLPGDRIGSSRTLTSTATGAMPYIEEALRWLPAGSDGRGGAGEAGEAREAGEAYVSSFSTLVPSAPLAPLAPPLALPPPPDSSWQMTMRTCATI